MSRFLERYTEHVYALLRVVAGLFFAVHGTQKLFGFPGGREPVQDTLMIVAGIVELAGGVLIALGLLTRPAAFLSSGQMAAAYFKAHAPRGFWPHLNGGELAALFCFLWLYVLFRGGGRFSLDALWPRGRRAPGPPSPPRIRDV
jgi:putative oxidoreductase